MPSTTEAGLRLAEAAQRYVGVPFQFHIGLTRCERDFKPRCMRYGINSIGLDCAGHACLSAADVLGINLERVSYKTLRESNFPRHAHEFWDIRDPKAKRLGLGDIALIPFTTINTARIGHVAVVIQTEPEIIVCHVRGAGAESVVREPLRKDWGEPSGIVRAHDFLSVVEQVVR